MWQILSEILILCFDQWDYEIIWHTVYAVIIAVFYILYILSRIFLLWVHMANSAFTSTQKLVHMHSALAKNIMPYNMNWRFPWALWTALLADVLAEVCLSLIPMLTLFRGLGQRRKFWHFNIESIDGSQHKQLFTKFGMFQGLNMCLTNEYSWITVIWSLGSCHLGPSPILTARSKIFRLVSNQYSHLVCGQQ